MSSLKEDWAYHKESQQTRYGYYCSLTRIKGEIPMPYHKWQEIDEKREYIIGIDLAKDATKKFAQEYDCEWVGEEHEK